MLGFTPIDNSLLNKRFLPAYICVDVILIDLVCVTWYVCALHLIDLVYVTLNTYRVEFETLFKIVFQALSM